ncbi:MAG: hypothetical protein FWB86_00440 [Treponema sp.]|nr:hypothetical protein [Treponema sp.]MCL2252180.1 hypothetical protein [Treponema sp.]
MKNKVKWNIILRMVGFIAIAAIIGVSIVACDFLEDLLHEHDPVWKSNATQHWKECSCGYKEGVAENHSSYYFTSSSGSCSICDKAHEHAYAYKITSTNHVKECTCGDQESGTSGTHSYFFWGKNTSQHWKECICGREDTSTPRVNHSFSTTYKFDSTEHWRECECYQRTAVADHYYAPNSNLCALLDCYYTKSVNSAFIGSWVQYSFYNGSLSSYTRYTFKDDGTGLSESKYSFSDEIYSTNFVWSASAGKLMLEITLGEGLSGSSISNYLIDGFTLSIWTNPDSKSYYIRQAGDGSMDERLTANTWINNETVDLVEELRFFPDGTASRTNKLGILAPTVTNFIWTAKDGQYKLYSVIGTESIFTYSISGNTLNTSNSASGARAYNKKYGIDYTIGTTGPGGGIVIYDKGTDKDGGWRYLEAALENYGAGVKWASTDTFVPGATGTAIGTGRANTLAIIAAFPDDTESNNASKAVASYTGGGLNDWFLPSKDELGEIFKQKSLLGITAENYFTSSEYGEDYPNNVFSLLFSSQYALWAGVPKDWASGSNYHARPVRYF